MIEKLKDFTPFLAIILVVLVLIFFALLYLCFHKYLEVSENDDKLRKENRERETVELINSATYDLRHRTYMLQSKYEELLKDKENKVK